MANDKLIIKTMKKHDLEKKLIQLEKQYKLLMKSEDIHICQLQEDIEDKNRRLKTINITLDHEMQMNREYKDKNVQLTDKLNNVETENDLLGDTLKAMVKLVNKS